MTRNEKIIAFIANGGTYGEAAIMFNVTRNVVCGICYRAGLKVGQRYNDRKSEIGRRNLEALRARAKRDPVCRAKWIASIKDGLARASR